jgi:hypothetical protein
MGLELKDITRFDKLSKLIQGIDEKIAGMREMLDTTAKESVELEYKMARLSQVMVI